MMNHYLPVKLICMTVLSAGFMFTSMAQSVRYDVVIKGGHVVDPETGLNAVRNIGIRDDRIEISVNNLEGTTVIDASGLTVSPGFIDLHVHGMTNVEQEYQAHDGVTTALELEGGLPRLREWYASRENKAMINYGASVSWGTSRFLAISNSRATQGNDTGSSAINATVIQSTRATLTNDKIPAMLDEIMKELQAGGIGIGVPIGYFPKATPEEDYRLYEYAGANDIPIFTHVRKGGIIAVQQAIVNAMVNQTPLHIVHMNSMALGDIGIGIEMVQKAQQQGFRITTELYPYTAASTSLQSALFDEGWQEAFDISYGDLQWVATGERLTEKTFQTYRKEGGIVIIHMMKPEWIAAGIRTGGTVIASDGMPYAKLAHPRTAGTFSRVLGKYVRQDQVLSLEDAIKKMTLLPARVLEDFVPAMKNKGRIQVGADADITIFNADTIIDKATFEDGLAFSEGVEFVIVAGELIIRDGKTVENILPGRPVYGKFRR